MIVSGRVVEATATFAGNSFDRATVRGVKGAVGAAVALDWVSGQTVRPGQAMRTARLSTARTDDVGNYTLAGVPTAEMRASAAANDGWLNFDLIISTGQSIKIESVSRHWDGTAWTDYAGQRPGQSPTDRREVLFAKDSTTGARNFAAAPANATIEGAAFAPTCPPYTSSTTSKWTNVIEFHNSADSDGRWEYGQTADSDIEVGLSYNNGASFSSNGTVHIGNSSGARIFGTSSANYGRYVATMFNYAQGYYGCIPNSRFIRATGWNGGTQATYDVTIYDCQDTPQSNYRVRYEKNTGFTKNSARAFTFTIGATIGNFTAKATSGYSTNVDMSWTFTRNWGYLCGNNDYPTRAQIVYAW